MLPWIGIALLAASWLFGLPFYHQPDRPAWALMVLLGVLFLAAKRSLRPLPDPATGLLAGLLMLPAALLAPWPWKAAFLCAIAGIALGLVAAALAEAPRAGRLCRCGLRLGAAALTAGLVLLFQGTVVFLYEVVTARSHELPGPLPRMLGAVAEFLGVHTGVHDSNIAVFTMREHHWLGATWELLADPVSLAFLAGAAVLLALAPSGARSPRQAVLRRLGCGAALTLGCLVWLFLRASLLIGVFLHSCLRTEYDQMPNSVHWLWNNWLHLAFLAVPVLLAWRLAPSAAGAAASQDREAAPLPVPGRPQAGRWRPPAAAALAFAAACSFTAALCWDPVGSRKPGRVVVEEYHPDPEKVWERCDKPFDTTWYGHNSGYNYYCIVDYLRYFYDVSRLTERISPGALEACDVLILKTPTRPFFSREELLAIRGFVERGGNLLLIGEHTDVFGSSTRLNPVAGMFGMRFRNDCLFGVDSVFEQKYIPPTVPHPVVQNFEWMDFATSCSLDVGWSPGRAVIRSTGLKNKTAEYHVSNFYPPPSDTARMRYGAFVQLWSTRFGRGRVLAFTDSTIFSNFCTFEPGKPELMVGMVEWLNRRSPRVNPRPWLTVLAALLGLAALALAGGVPSRWLLLLAAGTAGWAMSAVCVRTSQRAAMPLPEPLPGRDPAMVVMDQTLSDVILPRNGFIAGKPEGFGIFERWVLRLGYFTARRQAPESFAPDADVVTVIYPSRLVPEAYARQLDAYVRGGGHLLVVDSSRNTRSTATDLLKPFGIEVDHSVVHNGDLENSAGWDTVPIKDAVGVTGGTPFAWIGTDARRTAVGCRTTHGAGSVTVVGFGYRFCDQQMGVTGDVVPNEALSKVHAVEFGLFRALVEGKPLGHPSAP
ncbi:MAG: hypothetical protein JXR77_09440 [Lentisphaeria bacterium]|nr:hypothetical protein [Lentisphaeria bacterium]